MIVDSTITLDINELTKRQWRKLFSALTYQADDGEIYEPWRLHKRKKQVEIPRGAWSLLPDSVEYWDRRVAPRGRELSFTAVLDAPGFSGQQDAVQVMFEQEQGIVVAQPGFGKTNVALAFAADVKTPTLVLVHTEDILQQWVERVKSTVPDAKVGIIRGKKREVGDITISTVQTFRRLLRSEIGWRGKFGCVILDEAHHAPASTFDEILNQMYCKYRFGFTATDKRADGKHPYMTTVLGPVIYRNKFKSKVPVSVQPVKSGFKFRWRHRGQWRQLLNELKVNEKRNKRIAVRINKCLENGHTVLVLSREIDHLQNIQSFIDHPSHILAAKITTKEERINILHDFRRGKKRCVLATQLADEALDVPRLDRVFLTFPGKHDGRIIQQIGRALREHDEKSDAIIYDIVDDRVAILRRQWMLRKQTYNKLGIRLRKTRRRSRA